MKAFVTGASGYIGRAVAEALRRRGHRVTGLVRTAAKAKALEAREIEVLIGDMRDASWRGAASGADALIHCAVEYSADYQALDRKTVETLLGLHKKTIYTSGVWQYGPGGPFTEEEAFSGKPLMPWRSEHERLVLAAKGVVIRPGCVYGGAGGLTGLWFQGALERKAAPIVGDGANRWAVVHLDDLADLYVRAAEGASSGMFNGVDGSRFTVREMAVAASRAAGANGALKELGYAEAEKLYGSMAHGLSLDQHVEAPKASAVLGWKPGFRGFPADADRFFASWNAGR
jgi:nucleoside-diphosphate-sugar epimerase